MKQQSTNEERTLSFVKRFVTAFTKIVGLFGAKSPKSNEEFVDMILDTQDNSNLTPSGLESKRQVMLELCNETDLYHEKFEAALKAAKEGELEEWYDKQVEDFVKDTIPDADDADVKEVKEALDASDDRVIEDLSKELEKDSAIICHLTDEIEKQERKSTNNENKL